MKFRFSIFLAGLCFAGCQLQQSPPASVEDLAALQRKVDNLSKRVATAEQVATTSEKTAEEADKTMRQARADQSVLIEDLRNELKALKSQQEVQDYETKRAADEQKKFKQDLDLRLSELEQKMENRASAAPPASSIKVKKVEGETESSRYARIQKIFSERKDYDQVIAEFDSFLRDFPRGRYSANAQYWIGESYYAKGEYEKSIAEFQKVLDTFPNSEKACDSLLKQGYAFAELKAPDKAKLFLNETIDRCKAKGIQVKAKQRLRELAASASKQ